MGTKIGIAPSFALKHVNRVVFKTAGTFVFVKKKHGNFSRSQGMTTLREAGLKLIFDGLTTIDEVVRETVMEDIEE